MNLHRSVTAISALVFVAGTCLIGVAYGASPDPEKKESQAAAGAAKPAQPTTKPVSLRTVADPVGDKSVPVKPEVMPDPKPLKPVAGVVQARPKPAPGGKADLTPTDDAAADTTRTPDEALSMLREGNQRWIDGASVNPQTGVMRRRMTADAGQRPFAVVLTCADSRVPVERVFDRGVGEIFSARVAGNVAGTHEAGTVEYALEHLGAPLLVVMGHSRCGAVKTATQSGEASPNIQTLLAPIKPAVERARKLNPGLEGAELVEAVVRENVWQSVFDLLKSSPLVVEQVRSGKVKVVGAVLDIGTGKVEWMGEHPWQDAIVGALTTRNGETPAAVEKTAQVVP